MNITIEIDLSGINVNEIIRLHKRGVITREEILEHANITRFFSDLLHEYLETEENQRVAEMDDTVKVVSGW